MAHHYWVLCVEFLKKTTFIPFCNKIVTGNVEKIMLFEYFQDALYVKVKEQDENKERNRGYHAEKWWI